MNEVLEMESECGVNIDKVYKDQRPTHNMDEKMGPKLKKIARRTDFKKAGNSVAEKIKKGIPVDGSIEACEHEYKPPEIDWDKVNPRVKPSYIKKVEMKIIKKTKSKPGKVSFD